MYRIFRLSCYTLCNKLFQVKAGMSSRKAGSPRIFEKGPPALSLGTTPPSYVSVGEHVS